MQQAPKNARLHIGIFGRRNVGKSSVLNALTAQQVSIVSSVAGTTTDPVEKPMELLPLGPVLFIDTAGIDDTGALGQMRIAKTKHVFSRTDLGIIVSDDGIWAAFEQQIFQELLNKKVPVIIVWNKADLEQTANPFPATIHELTPVKVSAKTGIGIDSLRQALIAIAPDEYINQPPLVSDLVPAGTCAVLVVPIDKEAPKGRLILPQVQTIRELLDADAFSIVVKERELRAALDQMKSSPSLVVTDSQAFLKVVADTPESVPVTSFSILFARRQGDLCEMVKGAMMIDNLKQGDQILIAEACSHHPIAEDIGSVKIPRWLTQYVGAKLEITYVRGHDFPQDLTPYKLIIHCGACMWNRREMLNRIISCKQSGVGITNYGLTIAFSLGIFERALKPFPAALETYYQQRSKE